MTADEAAGEQAFAEKKWLLASEIFKRIAANETGSDALLMEARSLVNLADYNGAESVLRLAVLRTPRMAGVLYLLGTVQQKQGRPKMSLQTLTEAARFATPSAEELRTVALDYVLLEDYTDAIHWLERALEADPKNAEAWYDLARTHMHEGNFQKAIFELQRSLTLVPRNSKALDNLGVCLEAGNRQEEAMRVYEQAVSAAEALGPTGVQSFVDFGTLLNTRNEFKKASELLVHATTLAPKNSHAFEELSRADVGLGQLPQAQAAMEQAVSLDRKNSRLHFQLGRIYRSRGLGEKAAAEFKRSSELYGQHAVE